MKQKEIYIIHGWSYSIAPWTSVVSILRSSGVIVHQLRVPGLTEPSDKVWTIEDYITWLEEELEGVKNPIILGHSNGGRIGLNFALKHQKRLGKLILLNSAGINVDNQKVSFKRRIFKIIATIFKPLKYIPLVRKVVYRLIGGSDYERAPKNMKQTLDNMLRSDANLDVSLVSIKVDILWGRADTITPPAQGEKMSRLIPHAGIRWFDDWAHAPYITHPVELAKAILEELE